MLPFSSFSNRVKIDVDYNHNEVHLDSSSLLTMSNLDYFISSNSLFLKIDSLQLLDRNLSGSLLTISSTFNSLFKVLFIFPSRYLFAIGLLPIFSFRWDLPPFLGCILKQPDSKIIKHKILYWFLIIHRVLTFYDTLFQEILIKNNKVGIIIQKLQFDMPFDI